MCSWPKKTGFTREDAAVIKECLRTLFVNDASSARPEGSMEVVKLYWWEHNCKDGQYSSAKVHRSVHVTPKERGRACPSAWMTMMITLDELPGLDTGDHRWTIRKRSISSFPGIQHFRFCRRQWALIHIENLWAENHPDGGWSRSCMSAPMIPGCGKSGRG